MDRLVKIALFCILAAVMGFIAATGLWFILRLINFGTELLWLRLPGVLDLGGPYRLIYNIVICLVGGTTIGLWQKRFGILPDSLEQVVGKIKADGTYPYNRLHIIFVAALLPLIFGGAVGPEAGLSGIVAGLCCWIGDRLKYKGDQLAALAETGFAATLGVIFGAPLFGIISNLEPNDRTESYRQKLVSKRTRIVIYCFGVIGGMLSFAALDQITGHSGGLPRFAFTHEMGLDQWKWAVPLFAIGIAFSLYYQGVDHITKKLGEKLSERLGGNPLICCLIAGAVLAVCGYFFPAVMFSGEEELGYLIDEWTITSPGVMIPSAVLKLFLVALCINFGWRGGSIFPIIYSSALLGYSFALSVGMDGGFAVAVLTASLYAFILRKPATVIAVLLLCFPITYIIPIGISAIAASKIPNPFSFGDR